MEPFLLVSGRDVQRKVLGLDYSNHTDTITKKIDERLTNKDENY
jgi:hypothetical protein